MNIFKNFLKKHHIIHSWNEIHIYKSDYFQWIGLFWGWKHRYQTCDKCNKTRLIEGYLNCDDRYYLRPGFQEEL